ncbi:MAG: redox-regulated ATPase YchF [Candidatus Promineifilaceae bacterium]
MASLGIGIVGLPNVGKSTLFNALTKEQNALAANYPFATIEPNSAIVPVPDARLDKLTELVNPKKQLNTTIEFVDIAGLVKGASQGEGLGNQFLANIRDTAAIVHVVRCFDDENVLHVSETPDPRSDIEVINTELLIADLQQLERKVDRLKRVARNDKKMRSHLEIAEALMGHVEEGNPVSTFADAENEVFKALVHEMRFITAKKVIYAANVDEDGLAEDNDYVAVVRELADELDAKVIKVCAKYEEDMTGMSDEERQEFLEMAGAESSGLDAIIRQSYAALGLISYFTQGPQEVRAWTIGRGWKAPQAAGVIHTDFEKGFIRAQVMDYNIFIERGSEVSVKQAGLMRTEGKEYVVKDGDIIEFLFNV